MDWNTITFSLSAKDDNGIIIYLISLFIKSQVIRHFSATMFTNLDLGFFNLLL